MNSQSVASRALGRKKLLGDSLARSGMDSTQMDAISSSLPKLGLKSSVSVSDLSFNI